MFNDQKFEILGMKTMKYILLVICVACASTTMAVDYKLHQTSSFKSTSSTQFYSGSGVGVTLASTTVATIPTAEFRSTSVMPSVGSSLSVASSAGVTIDEGGNTQMTSGPKRVNPNQKPADPFLPLGDAVLPLLLLAAGYVVFVARKRRALKKTN